MSVLTCNGVKALSESHALTGTLLIPQHSRIAFALGYRDVSKAHTDTCAFGVKLLMVEILKVSQLLQNASKINFRNFNQYYILSLSHMTWSVILL